MKTTTSYQAIEHCGDNYVLFINIYGLKKLTPEEIQKITNLFDKSLPHWPIDYMEIAISIAPLHNNTNSYIFFVKTDNDIVFGNLYLGFSDAIYPSLEKISLLFVGKINTVFKDPEENKDEEEEEDEEESVLGSESATSDFISKPIDADQILHEFEKERRKKDEGK